MVKKRTKFKIRLVPQGNDFAIQFEKGEKDKLTRAMGEEEKKGVLLIKL